MSQVMCLFDLKMGRMEISNAIQLSSSHFSATPYTCDPRASCSPSTIFHMRYRVYREGKPCIIVCSLISWIVDRRFWWCRLRYGASQDIRHESVQSCLCLNSFRIRWIAILLAHGAHQSELFGAAFLHVMQLTDVACIST